MAKSSAKKLRSVQRDNVVPLEIGFENVTPLNYIQEEYLRAIHENSIIFGIGSAGTGKTYIAATYAAGELFHRRIKKIILTRPNIETGRGLGFLPGTLEEKYAPYLEPFDQIFSKSLGRGFYEYALNKKQIETKRYFQASKSKSAFYFYNPNLLLRGRQLYQSKWGNRPNICE